MITRYETIMKKLETEVKKESYKKIRQIRSAVEELLKQYDEKENDRIEETKLDCWEQVKCELMEKMGDYANIGSKILGTQIQYFTRQYLQKNPRDLDLLFEKYKKETSKEYIGEPYPDEIKKASRLFVREIVNAMNVQGIPKTQQNLYRFLEESNSFFDRKLRENYISLIGITGEFFKRSHLLEKHAEEFKSNMKRESLEEISYPIHPDGTGNLSLEESFSREHLETKSMEELIAINAFWQNRMAKDCKIFFLAMFMVDHLKLYEKEVDERNCESISDEQIEEFMIRKRFVNRLATARLRNMDFLSHEEDEIERKEKQYAGKYNKKYDSDLQNEVEIDCVEHIIKENMYLMKHRSICYLLEMLKQSSEIPNWGIVPEETTETNALIAIDLPGYNMPIALHIPKDILITGLGCFKTTKVLKQEDYILPIYEGNSDMKQGEKYFPTNILMPLTESQKAILQKKARETSETDKNKKMIEHMAANARGQIASHLKQVNISKTGVKTIERVRKYYDLLKETRYQKDETGHYIVIEETEGHNSGNGRE